MEFCRTFVIMSISTFKLNFYEKSPKVNKKKSIPLQSISDVNVTESKNLVVFDEMPMKNSHKYECIILIDICMKRKIKSKYNFLDLRWKKFESIS